MNNINKQINNQQGGFLKLIILIGGALFLMTYFNISVSEVVNWFKEIF